MPEKSKDANEKRCQLWQYHINEWSGSGITQKAYCRKNNLKSNRFTYWKNKFKRQNLPMEFVQVSSAKISETFHLQPRDALKLNVDSRFQVEIPDGFSQATLTQVLEVLRGI